MKFLKKNWLLITIVFAIILFIFLFFYIKQTNLYNQNPGLIPPRSNYDVQLDITDEEKLSLEKKVKEFDDLIQNFEPTITGSQEFISWDIKHKPSADRFYEKARALEYLGRYNESIKTLNQVFDYYQNSSVAWNNLWVLYARVWEHEIALKNFEKLVEVFGDPYGDYAERIVDLYLKLENPDWATQHIKDYVKKWWTPSINIINRVREYNWLKPFVDEEDYQSYVNNLWK